MFSDDKDFEEIYQALTPGLVVVACTPKSLVALRSFCFSLKGAGIRCGSDVMLYRDLGTPLDWDAMGVQLKEQCARGVRVHVINRFEDNSAAGLVARMRNEPGFDVGDGSINPTTAGILHLGFVESKITLLVTTLAVKEGQIVDRRLARLTGREQGLFIAVEHDRIRDNVYSVWVTSGASEKTYGVDFVSECPQAPASQTSAAHDEPILETPPQPRSSWLRRLLS
jgi:hypothetical protein